MLQLREDHREATFRDEVRDFLAHALPDELRAATRAMTSVYAPPEVSLAWQKILHAKGWAAPAWPETFGGCGWSGARQFIFATELARAEAPPLSPMGLAMIGPILIVHGTPAQQARHLPAILSGDAFWCQGYSEPEAGSDLAALRMRAEDDGDALICTGRKIWTTHAHIADWMFCLVRTSTGRRPQEGITFLLVDMRSAGVSVRPIHSLAREHIQNEVVFDAVRVPKANVVGAIGAGWAVAKHLMQFERGAKVAAPGFRVRLARIEALRADMGESTSTLGDLRIQVAAVEALEMRVLAGIESGAPPSGVDSSLLKTLTSELSQRLTEAALEAAGHYALPFQPHLVAAGGPVRSFPGADDAVTAGPPRSWPVAARYFNDRAGTIYAGASEVQRNIMAKALLS